MVDWIGDPRNNEGVVSSAGVQDHGGVTVAPKPGDRVGKYEIVSHLATGGMAEIYLARVSANIRGFERYLVVKRILPRYAEDREFVSMFLDEARIAATLQHANIAQVYDIDEDGRGYYISMEYVPGLSLIHI